MGARFFTIAASLLCFAIFAGANVTVQNWLAPARIDMTENRLFTLSKAAQSVTIGLSEPVELELIYSRTLAAEFPDIRAYGARVRELLAEIEARSDGNVRVVETDPEPFSAQEDKVIDAGLEAAPTPDGDPLYFGVIGRNSVDDEIIIPFLDPGRESLLEYDLVKLISQLDDPVPPVIGLLTDLPSMTGSGRNSTDPFVLREIARSFQVQQIDNEFQVLPQDLDALLIAHPWALTPRQQYEIEQFLLRGGRAIIALDPAARSAIANRGRSRLSSRLGRVETTLGLSPPLEVVIDREIGLPVERIENGRRIVESQPLFIAPLPAMMSASDPVTSELGRAVNFGAAGKLDVTPLPGVSFEPLIWTTQDAALISAQQGGRDLAPRDLLEDYVSYGDAQILAARMSGNFTSAFEADNIPPIEIPDDPVQARLMDVPEDLPDHLERSAQSAEIVLIADSDLLDDAFYVSPMGDAPAADNATFILNALDNLAGDQALVNLRSRAPSTRSMTRIDAMRDKARERLYEEQSALEARLMETEDRLESLRAQGAGGGLLATSDRVDQASAEELAKFRAEAIDIRNRLRDIEREFRSDIEALEQKVIFFTMWLPPLLTALIGMIIVMWRSRRKGH